MTTDTLDLTDIFSQTYKEPVTIFKEDPLVLATSLKDLYDKGGTYEDLQSLRVAENVTDEIRVRAEDIRKYYGRKFLWHNLNGKSMSSFRSKASSLLENRICSLTEQDRGIYFKLPWFYSEDMIYDEFKKTLNTTKLPNLGNKRQNTFIKRLTFLKTSTGWQKNRKAEYFWFKDDNNDLYGIQLTKDNPLLEMFKGMLDENPTPTFQTRLTEDRIDSLHFYKLHSFKFIKENNA
jgi:hypothetical protein